MDLHQYVPGTMARWMSLAILGRKREADVHLEIDDRSSTTRHQQQPGHTLSHPFCVLMMIS